MKKFLLRGIVCVLLLMVANFIYVLVVGGNLRSYEKKYLNHPKGIKLLILGDSHANRAWFSNTDSTRYNFAFGSDNITDMRYKFDYINRVNSEKGRKAVVLPFDAHLISIYRESKHNNTNNSIINDPYIPMKVIYNLPLIFDKNTELDFKRFFLRFRESENENNLYTFSKPHARSRLRDQFPEAKVSYKLIRKYQELINVIRENNYEIIAIKYSVHPYYDSLIRSSTAAIYLNSAMDSLASVNGLKPVDFSKNISNEKYYYDQDHLNRVGSEEFIRIFSELYDY